MNRFHSKTTFLSLKRLFAFFSLSLCFACGSSYNSHVTRPDDPSKAGPSASGSTATPVTPQCSFTKKRVVYEAQYWEEDEFNSLKNAHESKVALPYDLFKSESAKAYYKNKIFKKYDVSLQVDNYAKSRRACALSEEVSDDQSVFKFVIPALSNEVILGAYLNIKLFKLAENFHKDPVSGAFFCFLGEKVCSGKEVVKNASSKFWDSLRRGKNEFSNSYFIEQMKQAQWAPSNSIGNRHTSINLDLEELLKGASLPREFDEDTRNKSLTTAFLHGNAKSNQKFREIYVALGDRVTLIKADLVIDSEAEVCNTKK